MILRLITPAYYGAVIATAALWSIAVDWRPWAETGLVVREPHIWWAVLSLFTTVGLYIYRKKLRKGRSG